MAKHKEKKSHGVANSVKNDALNSASPQQVIPAISVIIPLYNVEQYVGECLDSLLAQTFQNFEVIVVDDCSTDGSVKVVESYAEKFGGRLKFTRMKENSGGAGLPRNKGIELSRGEYLSFVDPDDTITPTAFEELYTLAKKLQADVVHCEKHFQATHEEWRLPERRKLLKPYNYLTKEHCVVSQPILFTNDLEKRLIEFNKHWILWSVCLQMIRRDFVIEKNLRFINCYSEDMLFTMCELCCAKRYVMVPNVTYYYLTRNGSATSKEIDPAKNIKKYVGALVRGFRYLEDFFCDNKLFLERTDLKYLLFDFFFQSIVGRYNEMYKKHAFHFFDEFLRYELSATNNNELSAYIFNLVGLYRIRLIQARKQIFHLDYSVKQHQQRITELENEIKDLKNKE